MRDRRVVSLTSALLRQNLLGVLRDLAAVLRDMDSDGRHTRRVVATSLLSAIEQICRIAVELRLGRDKSTMPHRLVLETASIRDAAGLPVEVLVSLAYNFQRIEAIVAAFREHGIDDPFEGDDGLRGLIAFLITCRHDLVHTSSDVDFDMLALFEATLRLVIKIFRPFPGMEAEVRLMLGDIFKEMRLEERSRGQYEAAAELCSAMVEDNQDDARAHVLEGLALAGLGRHKEAVDAFDRSIKREPKCEAAHLGAAQALAKTGRREDALAACGRAVEIGGILLAEARSSSRRGRMRRRDAPAGAGSGAPRRQMPAGRPNIRINRGLHTTGKPSAANGQRGRDHDATGGRGNYRRPADIRKRHDASARVQDDGKAAGRDRGPCQVLHHQRGARVNRRAGTARNAGPC